MRDIPHSSGVAATPDAWAWGEVAMAGGPMPRDTCCSFFAGDDARTFGSVGVFFCCTFIRLKLCDTFTPESLFFVLSSFSIIYIYIIVFLHVGLFISSLFCLYRKVGLVLTKFRK